MTRKKVENPKMPMGVSVRKSVMALIRGDYIKTGDLIDVWYGYCPKCGGELAFDMKLSKYTCNDCGATFSFKLRGNKLRVSQWGVMPLDEIVSRKVKVKYAGRVYEVKEVKKFPHGTMFGIEDEPNHIDYINPESCEIVTDEEQKR